jgi:flavorubredoxin
LPEGTSYNAYLVRGSERTVLIDTVEHGFDDALLAQMADVKRLDYLVSNHAEQDHSGAIPAVLARFPEAQLICSVKAKRMLTDLLGVPAPRMRTVRDGETLPLGDCTLRFIYTPWVHWPETMSTFLEEDGILFPCDFFGSHLATSELFASRDPRVPVAAKRYYAEIMMPFRKTIMDNLDKLAPLAIRAIAPSHGPVHDRPADIVDAYREWAGAAPRNKVVIPYVSMHNSTRRMVDHLVGALIDRGVGVERFDLTATDIGNLAMALVDAGTLVLATPTVLEGPHPLAAYCALIANALKPKIAFLAVVGSFSWNSKALQVLEGLLADLADVERLPPVVSRGLPADDVLAAVDTLADTIAAKHQARGFR